MKPTTDEVTRWWDERPCNSRHSSAPADSLEYSVEVTRQVYDREPHRPNFMQPERWTGKHVLDAGCGIGTDTILFAHYGARVTAVDASWRSLGIAGLRLDAHNLHSRVSLQRSNLERQLFYPTTPIDLIYSFGVIHHTPHPDAALRTLRRIASPHTELRIMLYHRWSLKGLRLGLTDRRIARGSEARANCPVTHAYSRRSARRLLEETGWHVESITVDHLLRYRIRDGEPITPRWQRLPDTVYRRLARVLGWHLLIVARPEVRA